LKLGWKSHKAEHRASNAIAIIIPAVKQFLGVP
jgi:hypothetical protein